MAVTSPRFTHLLTFLLPKGAWTPHAPPEGWAFGCTVELGKIGLVSIMAPSREASFEVAGELLRGACKGLPATSVAARLYSFPPDQPPGDRDWLHVGSGQQGAVDGWSIIIGSEVAFSPTGLDPYFPRFQNAARPAPRAISQ